MTAISKKLKSILLAFSLLTTMYSSAQNYILAANINWPSLPAYSCTNTFIWVNMIKDCSNSTNASNIVTVSGSTITVDINYALIGSCSGPLTFPGHNISLGLLPAGSYTVVVNATWNSVITNTLTGSLNVISTGCCQSVADAGPDESVCDVVGYTLKGNIPQSFSSANWTVITGTGNINFPGNHNALATNLSYGQNRFVWAMSDSTCSTTDTVSIYNSQTPSIALTEADKVSCFDTITIQATAPTVGNGKWFSPTGNPIVASPNNSTSLASSLVPNSWLTWSVTNGTCPASRDTLRITYSEVKIAPKITANGYILESDLAPAYQWYKNGTAIPNETNKTHLVTSNGIYKVYASGPGCDNGLFSNEIEIKWVGIEKNKESDFEIYPNPTTGSFIIESGGLLNGELVIHDVQGKKVFENTLKGQSKELVSLPMNLKAGLYYISINDGGFNKVKVLNLVK